jgi:hypothetical protein
MSCCIHAKWIDLTKKKMMMKRQWERTAEAHAGAVEVAEVDAEEVGLVRPAPAAQEIHHVDHPPRLAAALVRVHAASVSVPVDDDNGKVTRSAIPPRPASLSSISSRNQELAWLETVSVALDAGLTNGAAGRQA